MALANQLLIAHKNAWVCNCNTYFIYNPYNRIDDLILTVVIKLYILVNNGFENIQ